MAAVGGVAALLVACGSDDNRSSKNPTTAQGQAAAKGGVERALLPRCGAESLGKPQIADSTSRETKGRAWTLQFARAKPPTRADNIKTVLVLEVSPRLPVPTKGERGVRTVDIAGRRVRFSEPTRDRTAFTAQWRTSKAVYTLVAVGTTPGPVRKLIECFP